MRIVIQLCSEWPDVGLLYMDRRARLALRITEKLLLSCAWEWSIPLWLVLDFEIICCNISSKAAQVKETQRTFLLSYFGCYFSQADSANRLAARSGECGQHLLHEQYTAVPTTYSRSMELLHATWIIAEELTGGMFYKFFAKHE